MRTLVAALLVIMTLVSPVAAAPPAAAATPGLPTYYAIKVLGYSVDHRPIRAYRMGSPGSRIKAVVLGQMHGDEHAGVIVADTMLLGRPVKDVDLWVIPSMNPDGNAVHTRQNAHHVDLNRNWPDHWVPQGGIFYSGPAPLSEPETKAVYAFLNSVKPTLLVSIHQPLNGVDTTDGRSRWSWPPHRAQSTGPPAHRPPNTVGADGYAGHIVPSTANAAAVLGPADVSLGRADVTGPADVTRRSRDTPTGENVEWPALTATGHSTSRFSCWRVWPTPRRGRSSPR